VFPPFCDDGPDGINGRRFTLTGPALSYYTIGVFTRPVLTPIIGIGTSAWENMVRRTRLAFRPPADFIIERENILAQVDSGDNDKGICEKMAAVPPSVPTDSKRNTKKNEDVGGFAKLFSRLSCELRTHSGSGDYLEGATIDFYGHSMGALVGNELVSQFPELPYRRIVYMAAATPIHDFLLSAGPLLSKGMLSSSI
jgi:hypothetical protein